MPSPELMGHLHVAHARGKEIFSFEYSSAWLKGGKAQMLDPALRLFEGPQYAPVEQGNFGIFLGSSPDRWGRLLMDRREAQIAKEEKRPVRPLRESDYLLGVDDGHRMGAIRFKVKPNGPFVDDNEGVAMPPWTSLRELEHAAYELEKENAESSPDYKKWIKLLTVPGSSLGGARPKASVVDPDNNLWIVKFPHPSDTKDVGAWEEVVCRLAKKAGLRVPECMTKTFNRKHRTFLSKRFDRTQTQKRIHFASAMTLLMRKEGDSEAEGASYLELVEFIMQSGAEPDKDLEELWKRIVFSICISNVDDHLRNHGFLLTTKGWTLSPVYDINPGEYGDGLRLNISESDNSQNLELAKEVAKYFRIKPKHADKLMKGMVKAVKGWRAEATSLKIPNQEQERMAQAFRVADANV